MSEKAAATLPGTVQKIIKPPHPTCRRRLKSRLKAPTNSIKKFASKTR